MKKFLSLVLALVMTMSLVTVSAGAKGFTDDSKIQYKEAVDVMSAAKVVDGYSEGDFRPDATLTRGAAAKIICNLILGPTTAAELHADTAPFKDVPVNHTFAGYIAFCAKEGIISGYADGAFRPAATLTSYAFMKMLLGALGYDAEVEQYVGGNWSINVAKRALNIGLDDGLKGDFNGIKSVTREEACLYALNTLTADMVEYDARTNINVGGAEVVIAGSEAKVMENKGKTDGKVFEKDGEMQFAEMYFDNLSVKKGTDDFERPSNVWKNKAEEIGTYSDTADLTYTAKVKSGDIYKDLDLGSSIDKKDVEIYVNGVENKNAEPLTIKKSGDDTVGLSGNGVVTEVYYDNDDDTVVITQVMTYIGEVSKTVEATSKKDAYVEISGIATTPNGMSGTEKFETNEEFEDESKILFTFSEKADEVKSVKAAESVTGTVTKVVNKANDSENSKVTIDGTEYKASKTMDLDLLKATSVDQDYTAYLDEYGYVIHVDEEDYKDYALVRDIEGSNEGSFKTNRAKLVFTDGTEKVVELDKNYKNKNIAQWDIVTYKEQDDGDYALKEVNGHKQVINSATFEIKNDNAKIVTGKPGADPIYANSKTMFVVRDNSEDEFDAYTGVKAVPSIKAQDLDGNKSVDRTNEKVSAFWYCKNNGTMATVMFIYPNDDRLVTDDNNDMLFLTGESVSDLVHDSDGDYYEYSAYINGEIKTVKVDASKGNKLNGLFSNYSMDSDEIITNLTSYTTDGSKDKFSGSGVGTDKNSGDYTVIVKTGTNSGTWTVDDDAKFFEVDEDGNITEGSYSSISKDNDDKTYFVIENGQVIYMFVEEVNTKDDAKKPVITKGADVQNVLVNETATLTVEAKGNEKGDSLSYQWYTCNVNGAAAEKISGATESTYKFSTANAGDYYFFCVVTNTNEKVDGKDTATETTGVYKVTVGTPAEATMNIAVNYVLDNGTVVKSEVPAAMKADSGKNYVTVSATAPEGYKVVGADKQYVNFVANGMETVVFKVVAKSNDTSVTASAAKVTGANITDVTAAVNGDKIEVTVTGTAADKDSIKVTVAAVDANASVNPAEVTLTYNTDTWTTGSVTVTAENDTTATYSVVVK